MTAIEAWGERLTPAFGDTVRRFPFPIVLTAIATGLILVLINSDFHSEQMELWSRAAIGVATAAVFATAGVFFAESRPESQIAAAILVYLVPAAAGILFQIRDTTWFVPYALPVIGALWLSVSSFTRSDPEIEAKFWWLNYRAVAAGAIAGVALGIICVGIIAIERAVATLFGLNASTLTYRIVLPVIGFFFAPLYWLSTLPRLDDYDPRVLTTPDFLARAVGLVGKFVLIPLLLAYAAILLVYAGQIAITQKLPQGTLGWMVMGFVVAGASAWLVLYPPFIRDSRIVSFFRRAWFWLTLLPLALFFVAVWVRIDAYGFTPERLVLLWGGFWAAILALIFIIGRGDIRLVPGLAAAVLVLATFGPWNIENLPSWQQGLRLDVLMSKPGPNGESLAGPSSWTPAEVARARSAIEFLAQHGDGGRKELVRVLGLYGHDFSVETVEPFAVMQALAIPTSETIPPRTAFTLIRDHAVPTDVSATPRFIGPLNLSSYIAEIAGLEPGFTVTDNQLVVSRGGVELVRASLSPLIDGHDGAHVPAATVDFEADGRRYRLVAERVVLANGEISYVEAMLFSAAAD